MAYPTSSKAQGIAHDLADKLRQRGSAGSLATAYGGAIPVVEGFDANGNPTISIGTLTAGSEGAFIHVEAQPWPLGTDALGLAAAVYSPTVIQVAIEAISALGVLPVTLALLTTILGEAAERHCRLELWTETSGTAPSITTFNTASKQQAAFEDFQYPMVGNV